MSKPITVYTAGTPNGYAITIALEELDVPYDVKVISLRNKEQKSDWFLKINPNGRIPAIVDHKKGDFSVFETAAILFYLAEHYDPEHRISYDRVKEPTLYSEEVQWLCWAYGELGPIQGQAIYFNRFATEKFPYGIQHYQDQTKRLFSVAEKRLEGREWLVGDHYGLADIRSFSWIRMASWSGVELTEFPNLQAWIKRCEARPKTYKGVNVPVGPQPLKNEKLAELETAKTSV